MTPISNDRRKSIEWLEDYQETRLKERFGKNYKAKIEGLRDVKDFETFIDKFVGHAPDSRKLAALLKDKVKSDFSSTILPTRFQPFHSYSILDELFNRIDFVATEMGINAKEKPFIGTAASREFNAFACKVPDTESYLIVFDDELFTLANLLAKIVVTTLPDFKKSEKGVSFSFDVKRIREHISRSRQLRERFSELVRHAIFSSIPNESPQYFLSGHATNLHFTLLQSLELFVVGHEYGHITAGHLKESNLRSHDINGKRIERITPNWEMEFEADRIGLFLLIKSCNENSLMPFCYLGPELFFTFLDLSERANNLLHLGKERRACGSDTHPPIYDRRKRVRQIFKDSMPSNRLESYSVASGFLENVFESLWATFKENKIKR